MLNLNFDPFPVLQTERLTLRRITTDDADEIYILRSNKETMHFIPRPLAQSVDDVKKLLEVWEKSFTDGDSVNWAITFSGEDKLIGMVGFVRMSKENFRTEIGYILHPSQHGKGIMTEAAKEIIRFGFETINYHSIEGIVDPENKSSVKVLEKSGFTKEAHFKDRDFYNGRFNDTLVYALHAKTFLR